MRFYDLVDKYEFEEKAEICLLFYLHKTRLCILNKKQTEIAYKNENK